MSFLEIRFPEDISYGCQGGPTFKTDITQTEAGYENRIIVWDVPLNEYDVSHNVETREDIEKLLAFFRIVRGRGIGFRFKDWTDFSATTQSIGVGNGTNRTFQLRKAYTFGDYTAWRTIKKPVQSTLTIYLNDTRVNPDDYTCDYTTGVVVFDYNIAAGVVVNATFEFDTPVRFDVDKMPVTADDHQTFSWGSISLVEVRMR